MPSSSVKLIPGLNTNYTPTLASANFVATNNVRFKDGLVQKRGGYSAYSPVGPLPAVPRAICPYKDSNGSVVVGVGVTNALKVIQGGVLNDITPVIVTATTTTITNSGGPTYVTPTIASTNGSATFTITDQNYGISVGDSVRIISPMAVGGVVLFGTYKVASIISANQYTITGAAAATSTSTGFTLATFSTTAGSRVVTCVLPNNGTSASSPWDDDDDRNPRHYIANITPSVTVGGLTIFGSYKVISVTDVNTFTFNAPAVATSTATVTQNNGIFPASYQTALIAGGSGTTTTTAYTSTPITGADWTLGAYGSLLVANSSDTGGIYTWSSTAPFAAAVLVPNSPLVKGILVNDASQQIIGYGAPAGAGHDPNYLVWSDVANYNTWTAAVGNSAGSYRIPTGSGIVGGCVGPHQIILWTDIDVWSMSYVGYPLVYGFNKIATGCGLLAQNACVKAGSAIYWMSQNQFWVYPFGGYPQPLPCPVTDSIFGQISTANIWKIRAGGNAQFNEAIWFFPSAAGNGENDTYVCYNYVENAWDMGTIARSAWCDQSIAGQPLGADPGTKLLHQHETSTDANGMVLPTSFTTGYFCINEGEQFSFIDWMRPDFKFPNGTGSLSVNVLVRDYAGDSPTTYGPYSFSAATEFIDLRCRGRFIALQVSGSDLGSMWRIGSTQFRFAPDGRR